MDLNDCEKVEYYDEREFDLENFEVFLKRLAGALSEEIINLEYLELKFGGWIGLVNEAL